MTSAIQFLKKMYLPGYMTICAQDYDNNKARFDFKPVEPQVTVLSDRYLTPRGSHILLSQGLYCFSEIILCRTGEYDEDTLQKIGFEGRLKIVRLDQRFRREIPLDNNVEGRLDLTNSRLGKMPILKFIFNLGSGSITGSIVGVIAPRPMPQTNSSILRPH